MLALLVVGLTSVCVLFLHYLVQNFDVWKKRGIPGPKPKPLFGNVASMILLNRNPAYEIREIYEKYKMQHNIVGIYFGRSPSLLVLNGQTARDVLVNKFNCFRDNSTGYTINGSNNPIFGLNVFFRNGDDWKVMRSQTTPAFTNRKVTGMYATTYKNIQKIHRYIENKSSSSIDAKELASCFTSENLSELVFGVEANAFENLHSRMKSEASAAAYNYIWLMAYGEILQFPILKQLLTIPVFSNSADQFYRQLTIDAIERRSKVSGSKDDFLDYFMHLKDVKGLSMDELIAHSANTFFDGYESSATTITQCLQMLSRNETIQSRLREELLSAELDSNQTMSYSTLNELPYLDQCINETLRLFVPGKDLAKICTESCTLQDKNGTIEVLKGDSITIPLYSLHRDEIYYKNPNDFDPDRFSAENGGTKPYKDMGVFMPFGDGPRICTGFKFATLQIKVALYEIISKYEIRPDFAKMTKDIEIHPTAFLCLPRGGVHLHFRQI